MSVVILCYLYMAKSIYQVADYFEKRLLKLANYPDVSTVTPIIQRAVDSAKNSNKLLLEPVKRVDSVNVQNSIDNMSVYFQLSVEPNQYDQLTNEPYKSDIINYIRPIVEQALNATFRQFEFKVKIGIVPLM